MVLSTGDAHLNELHAEWPTEREPLLLGALLTVRRELEILADKMKADAIRVHFTGTTNERLPSTVSAVFQSIYPISFDCDRYDGALAWPTDSHCGSYLSTIRLSQLHADPALQWPRTLMARAREATVEFRGNARRLALFHVRTQADADGMGRSTLSEWWRFIAELLATETAVVLLGDDAYDLSPPSGAILARERGLPLDVQLAAIGLADAFVGAASGISNAAILSRTPYIIVKDPEHHREAMQEELGHGDAFPFAYPRQRLLRDKDSFEMLHRSWNELWQ